MVVAPDERTGPAVVEEVLENDVAAAAAAAAEGQRRKAVVGVESWLPAEADHDEK
jgi:hypothetical protein